MFFKNIVILTIMFINLCLFGCGFKIESETNYLYDDDNLICIAKNYQLCNYFKNRYKQIISSRFDGIIEIIISDSINIYTNWTSDGSPRITKTITNIQYTIIKNTQTKKDDKAIVLGSIASDTPYQFESGIVSDLYKQKFVEEAAINQVIQIINTYTKSFE